MKRMILGTAAALSMLSLAACGGDGDDALGDRAEDAAENRADMIDDMADNATTDAEEDRLDGQAAAVRAEGERREEAIDDSDVDTDELTTGQQNAMVNGN